MQNQIGLTKIQAWSAGLGDVELEGLVPFRAIAVVLFNLRLHHMQVLHAAQVYLNIWIDHIQAILGQLTGTEHTHCQGLVSVDNGCARGAQVLRLQDVARVGIVDVKCRVDVAQRLENGIAIEERFVGPHLKARCLPVQRNLVESLALSTKIVTLLTNWLPTKKCINGS